MYLETFGKSKPTSSKLLACAVFVLPPRARTRITATQIEDGDNDDTRTEEDSLSFIAVQSKVFFFFFFFSLARPFVVRSWTGSELSNRGWRALYHHSLSPRSFVHPVRVGGCLVEEKRGRTDRLPRESNNGGLLIHPPFDGERLEV